MAKFDVYRAPEGGYWLDCQADLLKYLNSRFVVPLRLASEAVQVAPRLNPIFEIEGERVIMQTHFAAAISAKALRERVTSVIEHDMAISAALDMLISGY